MFNIVNNFEKKIAKFFGSPYAVATDCCTHAIELCLRYKKYENVYCPTNTYLSIPMTFIKLNLKWRFENIKWKDYYLIGNTNIYDAATLYKRNSYIKNSLMCLSFQFKKTLSLGRGGMILCPSKKDYLNLKKMSYDGRKDNKPWAKQKINSLGYHYYMTPETANLGIKKMQKIKKIKKWSYLNYPNLTKLPVFK